MADIRDRGSVSRKMRLYLTSDVSALSRAFCSFRLSSTTRFVLSLSCLMLCLRAAAAALRARLSYSDESASTGIVPCMRPPVTSNTLRPGSWMTGS